MMRTERAGGGGGGAGEFGLHNIVNVRNHVATPLMHEEISVMAKLPCGST